MLAVLVDTASARELSHVKRHALDENYLFTSTENKPLHLLPGSRELGHKNAIRVL